MQTHIGGVDISQGATWTTYGSADLRDMESAAASPAALAAGQYFIRVTLLNTHPTQWLYLAIAALSGVVPSTAHRIPVGPGASRSVQIGEASATAVSIRGSGADTTGHLCAELWKV